VRLGKPQHYSTEPFLGHGEKKTCLLTLEGKCRIAVTTGRTEKYGRNKGRREGK